MKKPLDYIKEAVKIYFKKENFIFFAKVMAVLTIISTSFGIIAGKLYPITSMSLESFAANNLLNVIGFVLLAVVMSLFGIYTRSTILASVLLTGSDVKLTYLNGWNKMWKYFLTTFIVGLIVLGGVILLVIPGIMFGVWFGFTLFLVMEKGLNLKDALKESKALVKGRFWKILGRFVVIGLFGVIITIVLSYIPYASSILISFIAPLYLLPSYLLYKDVSGSVTNN